MLARDRDEAEALERERDLRERFGLKVEALLPSAARRLEPALAPTMRSALHLPDDHSADPRLVCAALARAAERAGAVLRTGVEVADLGALPAEQVVVAGRPVVGRVRRRGARAPGQGPVAAPARPGRPRPAGARRALGPAEPGLPRAARRRALRARRDAGGARLRHRGHRPRRARPAARRRRARARRARARGRGGDRGPATRHARQRPDHRPLAGRPADRVGHRALPQRRAPRTRHRRPRSRRARGRAGRARLRARALRLPGGSNVGLPPSGRGRTDVRRPPRVGAAP